MKNIVAYTGKEYCVEWYFNKNGKSQALEYYSELDKKQKVKTIALFMLMGDTGQIRNKEKFNNEGDGIYAFKPKPDRFLCFFIKGKKIIITNGFRKKTDKLSPDEKNRALRYKDEYYEGLKEEKQND